MTDPATGPGGLRAAVAGIWRDCLGVAEVDDADNFFDEGGDSVLAVEAAMALRALAGAELELDVLYEHPEFGELVAALAGGRTGPRRTGERELTPAEQRLWAAERLHPGTPAFHISASYRFGGRLDVARLRTALTGLAEREDALRRGFEAPGRAFTAGESAVPCRWVDAGGVAEPEVRRLLADEARRPFDLARPPLLRALVVHRSDEGDVLQLTVHHLVCDGPALSRLESLLRRLYDGDRAEPDPEPAPQAVSARRQDSAAALAYWRETLAGRPDGVPLPRDRDRRAPRAAAPGAVHSLAFPEESLTALLALAERERLSPFMAWIAAYAAGLAAVTGERDLVIAVPVSVRGPEQQREIGMFVDLLPLRIVLPPGTTARELARRVRRAVTGALAHQRLPDGVTMEDLWPAGGALARPVLTYVDVAGRALRLGECGAERELVPTGTAKYDLLWSVTKRSGGTVAELEYRTDVLSDRAAAELHGRMAAAVGEAFARPDAELPETEPPGAEPPGPAASAESSAPVPAAPPETAASRPGAAYVPIHERVRRQASIRPGTTAIEHHDLRLTYRELDERASAVAAGLRAAGLRRGAVVAVAIERGADAVTACLGVLYAGCAYLPVDVRQPAERTRTVVRAAARAVLVADDATAEPVADLVPVLTLDALLRGAPAAGPAEPVRLTGEDVAYVMSTSGSTGTPKAVVVPHRAITRLVPDADYVTVTADDRVAHLSNPAFDAATFEIWGALAAGATLVVGDRDVALSPARLRAFAEDRRITVMWLTATLLGQVADVAPDAFAGLRVLLFGGERADERRLEKLLAGRPPVRLVNGYGPTENTTFSTAHEVTTADLAAGTLPIGRPISGSTGYVLDSEGRPVAAGESGELYVGGDGLAHGYLGAPAATADAFVPDPFDPRPGRRMYRTGDQVRLLSGGRFEFVGRRDDQVKVRGFRVELGEVDQALRRRPEVGDVAVLARATEHGTEIVACVTAAAGPAASLDVPALTASLRRELPEYMVPTVTVVLDRIPVNANGKADRPALLAAAQAPPADPGGTPGGPDLDEAARVTGEVWREILGVERARPADDFLMVGGHSIKAMRLLSRLDEELGAVVDIVDFFERPTLGRLVELVREATSCPLDPDGAEVPDVRAE